MGKYLLVAPSGWMESSAPSGYPQQVMLEYRQNSVQDSSSISLKMMSRPSSQESVRHVSPRWFLM